MLRSITWAQLREWEVYDELDPFDESRADIRSAQIVAAILNVNHGKGQDAVKIEDVLIEFGDQTAKPKQPDWQEMKAMGKMMSALFSSDDGQPRRLKDGPRTIQPMPEQPRNRRHRRS